MNPYFNTQSLYNPVSIGRGSVTTGKNRKKGTSLPSRLEQLSCHKYLLNMNLERINIVTDLTKSIV